MPPKRNPLKLNALQLKTLTIIQALTESDEANSEERPIPMLPPAHGNHFHRLAFITPPFGQRSTARGWSLVSRLAIPR